MKNFKQEFIEAARREQELEEKRMQLEGELRGMMTNLQLDFNPTHIWAMGDVDGYIGLRFDCGDSGTVYLTKEAAADVVDAIQAIQEELGWK